ncbi:MAG: site-specific DNA-methyltransferase [Bradyrhizobium sp.]|nr:MAG: site-specific DNA-methyltransferase [Bradyrhizobium sp.]
MPAKPTTTSSPVAPRAPSPALTVTYLPLDQLAPDPANARRHSAKQVRLIAASIEAFGFNVPVLIDAEGRIMAGHGRIMAAKRLGWREVPVIRLEHLSDAQRRAFMIADNRLAEVATWDDQLLAEQLQALSKVELAFDIETIGFDMGEIDLRIESLEARAKTASVPEPPLVEPTGPAVTMSGDLWSLGRHRLLCGDARDAAAHAALMGDERAAAAFCDPPYNLRIDGVVSGLGKLRHREFVMGSGEMTPEAFTAFLEASLAQIKASCLPGSVGFICMDWRHLPELIDAARLTSIDLLNLCVWAKPTAGMGSLYRSQHELVFVLRLGAGRHRNNVQLGAYSRNRSNVWSYATGPGFGRAGEEGRLADLHPTVKPTAMVADAILDVTKRGDIVLDPFLGSGTTLMACERTGRRCYGMELDPLYCDVILRRWQGHTGAEARLAATGEPFSSIAERRREAEEIVQ